MIDGLVAKRYAEALYDVAKENDVLEKVEEDLLFITETINKTDDFMAFFRHPKMDISTKKEIIDSSFKDSISPISKNFLFQLIDNHRVEFVGDIQQIYVKLSTEARGILDVEVTTADSLNSEDKEKVSKSLEQKFKKQIRLKNVINSSVLGGMIIRIGDRVYDGSVNTQLKLLKRSLTASRV